MHKNKYVTSFLFIFIIALLSRCRVKTRTETEHPSAAFPHVCCEISVSNKGAIVLQCVGGMLVFLLEATEPIDGCTTESVMHDAIPVVTLPASVPVSDNNVW